jgi:hypothetical protein
VPRSDSPFGLQLTSSCSHCWQGKGHNGQLRECALFPALIGWLLFCFFLGILSQAAREVAKYFLGPESPARAPCPPEKMTQVVILGGGFAGVSTAEHLEKQFRSDPTVSLTLISETNSWLFTPMLVEVATSGLEPTHITTPLRTSLKRTRARHAVHSRPPHSLCRIRGLKFSGLFAWLLWRGVYLSKLPGLERKARVLTDWMLVPPLGRQAESK